MKKSIALSLIFLCLILLKLDATVADVIEKLQQRSRESGSDVVLISREGRLFFEYCSGDRSIAVDTGEISRSFVSLAVGLLVDEGKIPCLDVPVKTFFPEWSCGLYSKITLRQLLNNTSGLGHYYCCGASLPPPAQLKCALEDTLQHYPGQKYFLNRDGAAVAAGIVQKVSGKELGDYLAEKLFLPAGIDTFAWASCSTQGDFGLPRLVLRGSDLLKVGEIICRGGMLGNDRIISERWLKESAKPSQDFDPFFGLQWWLEFYDVQCYWDDGLLQMYCRQGVSPDLIARLRSLQGRVIHFGGQVWGNYIIRLWGPELNKTLGGEYHISRLLNEVREKGLPLGRFCAGEVKSIMARGKGGQQLIVMPKQNLVAVRLKALHPSGCQKNDIFEDLPELMDQLSRECDAYID